MIAEQIIQTLLLLEFDNETGEGVRVSTSNVDGYGLINQLKVNYAHNPDGTVFPILFGFICIVLVVSFLLINGVRQKWKNDKR